MNLLFPIKLKRLLECVYSPFHSFVTLTFTYQRVHESPRLSTETGAQTVDKVLSQTRRDTGHDRQMWAEAYGGAGDV
jgi:hypothetical protein